MQQLNAPNSPMSDPISILNGRIKNLPGVSYKLAGGNGIASGQYAVDIVIPDEMSINEKRMSCWIPFADGNARDGVGDVTEVSGIVLERHLKNPISLFDHGKNNASLPIGLAEDRDTGAYTVVIDPIARTAGGEVFFYMGKGLKGVEKQREFDHAVFCEQIFDLLVKKMIRGASFGYQVIEADHLPPDYVSGKPQGLHLLKTLLLEFGPTVIPANQDTVRKCLAMPSVCGKQLSPYLVKSLAPYATEAPAQVVSGFEKSTPIPHGDMSKTDIPPAKWKPGEGAEKSQIAGDLDWLNEEQTETEHKSIDLEIARVAHSAITKLGYGLGRPKVQGEDLVYNIPDPEDAEMIAKDAPKQLASWGIRGTARSQGRDLIITLTKSINVKWQVGDSVTYEGQPAVVSEIKDDGSVVLFFINSGENRHVAPVGLQNRKSLDDNDTPQQAKEYGKNDYRYAVFFDQNPYKKPELRKAWEEGWKEAKEQGSKNFKSLRMKYRQKSVGSREYQEGYHAGRSASGKPCPFYDGDPKREDWIQGYKDGADYAGWRETDLPLWAREYTKSLPNEDEKMDATRERRTKDPIRQEHYAQERQQRFARHMGFPSPAAPAQPKKDTRAKTLSALRKKYRPVKSMRRRLRKSIPGSSLVYVGNKDLEKLQQAATGKGLKFTHMGPCHKCGKGIEKVKLSGDDSVIDELAKNFGRRGKSLGEVRMKSDKPRLYESMNIYSSDIKEEYVVVERDGKWYVDRYQIKPEGRRFFQSMGPWKKKETAEKEAAKYNKSLPSNSKGVVTIIESSDGVNGTDKNTGRPVRFDSGSYRWCYVDTQGNRTKETVKGQVMVKEKVGTKALSPIYKKGDKVQLGADIATISSSTKGEDGSWVYFIKFDRSGGSAQAREEELKSAKSLNKKKSLNSRIKQMPNEETLDDQEITNDLPQEGMEDQEEENVEPYGAQVLRRVHQDHSILMKEYDEMMGPLEHDGVKAHLTEQLERLEEILTKTEEMFAKEYEDLPQIEGMMEEEGEVEKAHEEEEEEPEVTGEEEETEEKDLGEEEPENEADSEEEEEPTADEAIAGMKKKSLPDSRRKSIQRRIKMLKKELGEDDEETEEEEKKSIRRKKSVCLECGKEDCNCRKKALGDEDDPESQMEGADELEEVNAPQLKSLEPHHVKHIGEARDFLRDAADTHDFGDEHRLKSFHYHKALDDAAEHLQSDEKDMDPMGMIGDALGMGGKGFNPATLMGNGLGGGDEEEGKSFPDAKNDSGLPLTESEESTAKLSSAGTKDVSGGHGVNVQTGDISVPTGNVTGMEGKSIHPHYKTLKDTAGVLKEFSTIHDYGDEHREKALLCHKALDPILEKEEQQQAMGEEVPPVEPGEMRQKTIEEDEEESKKEKVLKNGKKKTITNGKAKHLPESLKKTILQQNNAVKQLQKQLEVLNSRF